LEGSGRFISTGKFPLGSKINLNWCSWLANNVNDEGDSDHAIRTDNSVQERTYNHDTEDEAVVNDNSIQGYSCHERNNEDIRCRDFADIERVWSLTEISGYNGLKTDANPSGKIFLSVGGIVFDVSKGIEFYGVGQHYHCFAARAVTRALALGSLEKQDIELGDQVEDFTEKQIQNIRNQLEFYTSKYVTPQNCI